MDGPPRATDEDDVARGSNPSAACEVFDACASLTVAFWLAPAREIR
jgi:hypothetical protein